MKKRKKKLALFGPYPPPIGGVSVHIERISKHLKAHEISYTIFNYGRYNDQNNEIIATKKSPLFYLKFIFERRFDLIHFHNNIAPEYLYYFIFSYLNRTPLLLTIHSESLIYTNPLIKNICLLLLKKTKRIKVISVSETLSKFLRKEGVNASFLPAYVAPPRIAKVA